MYWIHSELRIQNYIQHNSMRCIWNNMNNNIHMYNYEINYTKKIIIRLAYYMDYVLEIEKWLFNLWCTTTTFKIRKLRRKFSYFFH